MIKTLDNLWLRKKGYEVIRSRVFTFSCSAYLTENEPCGIEIGHHLQVNCLTRTVVRSRKICPHCPRGHGLHVSAYMCNFVPNTSEAQIDLNMFVTSKHIRIYVYTHTHTHKDATDQTCSCFGLRMQKLKTNQTQYVQLNRFRFLMSNTGREVVKCNLIKFFQPISLTIVSGNLCSGDLQSPLLEISFHTE